MGCCWASPVATPPCCLQCTQTRSSHYWSCTMCFHLLLVTDKVGQSGGTFFLSLCRGTAAVQSGVSISHSASFSFFFFRNTPLLLPFAGRTLTFMCYYSFSGHKLTNF
ncbi:hypothetical protein, unlikely [Trypanosoma brucei gambiense DAL972]|uniref:Uncharacterized protein n=1 Tax=Trypanosoma brucei gambiense (strain MHOM/CI/86/DAL972) TaxID=679716 RepID=D0A8B8_TRYB9|nr:hypothetical protein, unlikely [Trypanosoma brucei gambiense DAL972]CBH17919.1 hypothetical protein, unlikely [Trypanosoma brucei gambiense DAL972]|eukprot:XP_011780183.1 hypothetical protein, unlikely [Trypanosoma brucei gambiense DAL972]